MNFLAVKPALFTTPGQVGNTLNQRAGALSGLTPASADSVRFSGKPTVQAMRYEDVRDYAQFQAAMETLPVERRREIRFVNGPGLASIQAAITRGEILDFRNLNLRVFQDNTRLLPGKTAEESRIKFNFKDVILPSADFSQAEFSDETQFNNATLTNANFTEAQGEGLCFKSAHLVDAKFDGAQLWSSHFEYANLSHAKFTGANLSLCFLRGACLTKTGFLNTDLSKANLWRTDFRPVSREQFDPIIHLAHVDEHTQLPRGFSLAIYPDGTAIMLPTPEGVVPHLKIFK